MGSVIIGKHTLESLTSGMYSDPYVVIPGVYSEFRRRH